MALLNLLLHLLLLTTTVTARNTTYCSEVERQALLAIKTGFPDAAATRLSSWKGFACCSWTGVSCTAGHVVKLDLSDTYWTGVSLLSPSLLHLTHLQYLDLSGNSFGSPIPTFIGSLTHLSYLNLADAGFVGRIPPHLGNLTRLISLDLSHNSYIRYLSLTADSLTWLSALRSIQYLDMGDVDLSNVTNWLNIVTTLPSLSVLRLHGCQLSGNLVTLGHFNLTSLTVLDLSFNSLGGTIPATIGNLTSLTVLRLSHNYLGGTIPATIGNLTNLHSLYLSYNNFTGEISLDSNSFTGEVTEAHLSNLVNLKFLDLGYNFLTVNVSESWLPPFKAITIRLSSCKLGPKFPTWLRNQISLSELDLSRANISDMIPGWFVELLPALQDLNLSSNQLNGEIPRTMNFVNIDTLDLSHNKFEGLLPKLNIGFFIDISYNNFSGPISKFPSDMEFLEGLILSHNRLNGSISPSIRATNSLVVADLSYNEFSGELPDCWGNSSSTLEIVNFSNNKLSGKIPSSMGNLYQLMSLRLSDNKLTGEIPDELTKLLGLIFLNLSGNHLRGGIPIGIGQLKELESLDMSMNELSGSIPYSITFLYFLETLVLSNNNLSGPIPFGGQMSTFSESSFSNNVNLCGPPLPKKCLSDKPSDEGVEEDEDNDGDGDDDDDSETIWNLIIGFAPGLVVGFGTFIGVTMIESSTRYAYFQFIDRIINLCM